MAKLSLTSALTLMAVFRDEAARDFSTWSRLPNSFLQASVPLWREAGAAADGIYSAEQFELYRRFGIGQDEWCQRCGEMDVQGLASYRERYRMACWSLMIGAGGRAKTAGKKVADKIRVQLQEKGILPPPSGEAGVVSSDVLFKVDSISAVLCTTAVSDGVRITLALTELDPARAFVQHDFSHSLGFIDAPGLLSADQLAAIEFDLKRNLAQFQSLLACEK